MSSYQLQLTTLTPLHIGSGAEYQGNIEYLLFKDEGVAALVDDKKVLDVIGAEHLSQWVSVIDKDEDLLDLLKSRSTADLKANDVAKRLIPIKGKQPALRNNIKAQLFTGIGSGSALLPGSSVKGAIRSVLLAYLIKQQPSAVNLSEMLGSRRYGKFRYNDSQVTARFFGKRKNYAPPGEMRHDPNKDWLRFLRVSDVTFDSTQVYESVIINKHFESWKVKEKSFWECIPEQLTTSGKIQVPDALIDEVEKKRYIKTNRRYLVPERLCSLINEHTKELLEYERDILYEEYHPDAFEAYDSELERIVSEFDIANEYTCILRIGAGGGWDYMTGAWLRNPDAVSDRDWGRLKNSLRRGRYPDHLMFPKSRKLLAGGIPLGFVKIKFESDAAD